MSTQTPATETTAEAITEATGAGTEYGDKRAELAPLLYELYAGRGGVGALGRGDAGALRGGR